jgi:hypothetical protein
VLARRDEFWLHSSFDYLFEHLDRFAGSDESEKKEQERGKGKDETKDKDKDKDEDKGKDKEKDKANFKEFVITEEDYLRIHVCFSSPLVLVSSPLHSFSLLIT